VTNLVVVWDQREPPNNCVGDILLWQGYSSNSKFLSIPGYLEEHAKELRAKYLAFIHDLGETELKGKKIVEHLDIGDNFSLWWMTTLAEKSTFKSPKIYDCLRLIALEEILRIKKPSELFLESSDRNLISATRQLCKLLNITFSWKSATKTKTKINWSRSQIFKSMPYTLQGIIFLIWHIVSRRQLRYFEKLKWYSNQSAMFICSYFIHVDPGVLKTNRFHSNQWEQIPQIINDNGLHINWVHHFMRSSVVPNDKVGMDYLNKLNRESNINGVHSFLDSYISIGIIVRVFKRWIWLHFIAYRLRKLRFHFYPSKSAAWLWPFLRSDWFSSIIGQTSIANCLWVELFDAMMRDLPPQKNGLFLCENQGWERAFLHSWRKYGHGKIIGVQHATVPFWHLYYFDDPRTIKSKEKYKMPLPDKLAVNGPMAWEDFIACGYRVDQLIKVEAVRYLNIENSQTKSKIAEGEANVLILGDMISESNHILLNLLEGVVKLLPCNYNFTFKVHPGLNVDLLKYPSIRIKQTSSKLNKILKDFDIALSANSTSAAVDAFLAGLPVIIAHDGKDFNLSPLRGLPDVSFVCTSEELVSALTRKSITNNNSHEQNLFWLDSDLHRWKHFLSTMNNLEADYLND
jgi:surface carbohydrate biosynthesis protein (TIGR04326 family)